MRRFVIGLAVVSWYVLPAAVAAREAAYDVEARAEVKIPMGDGVRLSANIFLPKGEGRFPVLLTRTPYGKGNVKSARGPLLRLARVRLRQPGLPRPGHVGRRVAPLPERSGGRRGHAPLDPRPELVERPHRHDGRLLCRLYPVGIGAGRGDSLQAMFPIVPLVDPHGDVTYVGGSLQLALTMGWGTMVSKKAAVGPWVTMNWPKAFRTLPLCTWDTAIGGKVQYLRDWVAHPQFDEYWRNGSVRGRLGEVTVPIYAVGGWYDIFSKSVLEHVNTVRKTSRSQNASAINTC